MWVCDHCWVEYQQEVYECHNCGKDKPVCNVQSENTINDQYLSEWMREIVPSSTTLMISWKDTSKDNSDITGYLAKYRKSTEKQFAKAQSEGTAREIEIFGLKPNTIYEVKVFWVDGQGEIYCMFEARATTTESKSLSLIDKYTFQMGRDKEQPIVYPLKPLKIKRIGENIQLRICDMIQDYNQHWDSNKEKTILLVGATGTGKSTFIDALINYVAEVSYSEDHRLSIVSKTEEEELREKDQTGSQTSSITIYRIPELKGLKVKHKINVIDTPGFNDTREDFDKKITTQMKHLFEKTLEHVDAICLVLQLSTNRLTEGQKHVFKSILELFGKDVKNNVFLIITHYDGGSPEACLKVVEEAGIPYKADKHFFLFNNSNLFAKNEFGSRVWEERTKSFSKMFQVLDMVPRTAVEISKEVMQTRFKLENKLEGLRDDIRRTADRGSEVMKIKKAVKTEGTDDTKDKLSIELEIAQYEQKHTQKNSMNCPGCKKTCHRDCWAIFDILFSTCEIFENGVCTVCNCQKGIHVRGRFIYEKVTKEIKIEVPRDEIKLRIEFEESLKTLQLHMGEMKDHIVKLTEIALSPPKHNAMEVQMSNLISTMDISVDGKKLFKQCLSLFMKNIPFINKISRLFQEE